MTRPRASAAVPEGCRVYAVGDIHGRLDLLENLLAQIEDDDRRREGAETTLIFLGDLVDRGPDSCGVVERLYRLREERPGTRFIAGNHEEVFLRAARGDVRATRFLVRIGGKPTIFSYGISEAEYSGLCFEALTDRLKTAVPQHHVTFLASFEDRMEIGDYLFVHAGMRPGVPIEEQSAEDLRWIRREFLDCAHDFGKVVVHGHTVTEEVEIRPNRIGIDTGAYESGRLTALALEGGDRWFLST
jgi:serine/threonine protein phosphatase 1